MMKIFTKEVTEKIGSGNNVTYRRKRVSRKFMPTLIQSGEKIFDIKKGMWRQEYIFWIFRVLVFKVWERGITKTKYKIKFK